MKIGANMKPHAPDADVARHARTVRRKHTAGDTEFYSMRARKRMHVCFQNCDDLWVGVSKRGLQVKW